MSYFNQSPQRKICVSFIKYERVDAAEAGAHMGDITLGKAARLMSDLAASLGVRREDE